MKKDMSPRELSSRLQTGEPLCLIDVRSPAEFAECHVPGARNVPLQTLGASIPGVGANETVVMICKSGMRSATACGLVAATYPTLFNVVGGTMAWVAEGLPTEDCPKA